MGRTLNYILQAVSVVRKPYLTSPAPHLKLVFKEGAVTTIKRAKGWKTDAEMARVMGITRAYVSMLSRRKVSVSHNVILRLAYLMNNTDKWWLFYEVVDTGEPIDPNHPIWNMEKFEGRMPYTQNSSMADLRKKDYNVEKRT